MKYRKPVKALAAQGPGSAAKGNTELCIEECFKLKSKFQLLILAITVAALMPMSAAGQLAKEKPRTQSGPPAYKWEAFALAGYTSLNQVNQSRYGLQGVNVSLTRDFGKYFGVTAEGAFYKYPLGSGNPGTPVVDDVLLGPVLHANIYGRVDGFVHVLLGSEHTGGENQNPNITQQPAQAVALKNSHANTSLRHQVKKRIMRQKLINLVTPENSPSRIYPGPSLPLSKHAANSLKIYALACRASYP